MKTNDEQSLDTAPSALLESLSARHPRRTLLKGAVTGAASGAALSLGALLQSQKQAHANTSLQQIFDIAVTIERLAVTTYNLGFANASAMGISGSNLSNLQAALVEEQIHELFLESLGAIPLTSTFSYQAGPSTFTSLPTFIQVQQQLAGMIASFYLAAVSELAQAGQPRWAQIFAQIACIKAEHRILGRSILGQQALTNYAFEPVFLASVSDAPAAMTATGYLSPVLGNSYTYAQISTALAGIDYRTPFVVAAAPSH